MKPVIEKPIITLRLTSLFIFKNTWNEQSLTKPLYLRISHSGLLRVPGLPRIPDSTWGAYDGESRQWRDATRNHSDLSWAFNSRFFWAVFGVKLLWCSPLFCSWGFLEVSLRCTPFEFSSEVLVWGCFGSLSWGFPEVAQRFPWFGSRAQKITLRVLFFIGVQFRNFSLSLGFLRFLWGFPEPPPRPKSWFFIIYRAQISLISTEDWKTPCKFEPIVVNSVACDHDQWSSGGFHHCIQWP